MYPILGTFCDENIDIFDNMAFKKIRRSVKNYAYTDTQKRVRQATNNDRWGPSSLLLSEIAEDTKDEKLFYQIMQLIWERFEEDRKQWRHIYKALYLLEYLLKAGDDRVRQYCNTKNWIEKIIKLRNFKHIENGIDRGLAIDERIDSIFNILQNVEVLQRERQRSIKVRDRCIGVSSNMGASSSSPAAASSSSKIKKKSWKKEFKRRKNVEKAVEATEHFGEDNAYQLALALSEREMEEIEHVVEQEDEMLQIAIEESKKAFAESFSNIPERPFSPPPILSSSHSQQPKLNAIDEITNEIMALDFYQPISPDPTSASSQQFPSLNDSFYKLACTPTISSPSSKNLPDVSTSFDLFTTASANSMQTSVTPYLFSPPLNQLPENTKQYDPFKVENSKMIQNSVATLTPHYQNLPDMSAFSFDPFAAASANSMQTSVNATTYLPELPAPTSTAMNQSSNPFEMPSSKNVKDSWDFGFVAPPTNNNDPWSSTTTATTPYFDIFNTTLQDTVTPSARGCSSSEAYQKMEKAFRSFNLSSASQNYHPPSQVSSQISPPANSFLNDQISINGRQYSRNNPFIKDMLF
uniref:ENTH domain-containing protein n=1 Tax=Panagrolaimus sp. ES5 TaxID=591445 RepID=A0AC34GRN8_9BILA